MAITLVGSSGFSAVDTTGGGILSLTVSTGAIQAGDLIVVNFTRPSFAGTTAVVSSDLVTPYIPISGLSNGLMYNTLWYRVATSNETQAVCLGSTTGGTPNDVLTATSLAFRGHSPYVTVAVNNAAGTSSMPDSPAVPVRENDAIISAIGIRANSTTFTGPAGWLNQVSATGFGGTGGDTASAMIWITSTFAGAVDPAAWVASASNNWVAQALTIRSTDPYTPFDMVHGSIDIPQLAAKAGPSRIQFSPIIPTFTSPVVDPHIIPWYSNLVSRPLGKRFLHPALQNGAATAFEFGSVDPHSVDWYSQLSEPLRISVSLMPQHPPYLAFELDNIQYSFNIAESGDTANLVMGPVDVQRRARVSITEIDPDTAGVAINEINYTKKYS